MKKDEHITAYVKRHCIVQGELGQSVIDVEYIVVVEAVRGLVEAVGGLTEAVGGLVEARQWEDL